MPENGRGLVDSRELVQRFRDPAWGAGQLRRISILAGFTDDELVELYNFGRIRSLKAKAHAVVEGEPTRGLYILLHGTVSVYKTNKSNNSLVRLAVLEEGAVFGELSLFDNAPRSATVATESPCHLFYLDADSFASYLDRKGENLKTRFFKKCAEDMVEKFRQQNADYVHSQLLLWQYALRQHGKDHAVESESSNSRPPVKAPTARKST